MIPVLNFLPPFFRLYRNDQRFTEYNISESMVERLGLITIIVFGENILGVINGMSGFGKIEANTWIVFGFGILIVFLLWWIFFALVADRMGQKGFWNAQFMMLIYIPALASLGAVGATFSVILKGMYMIGDHHIELARVIFGIGLAGFLLSVLAITRMLVYPKVYDRAKSIIQPMLLVIAVLILLTTALTLHSPLLIVFVLYFVLLLILVVLSVMSWFRVELSLKV
jgi:low temperature requirement protein LtrA